MMLNRIGKAALVLLLGTSTAFAQRPADVVHWVGKVVRVSGALEVVSLEATIQPGWHVYAPSQQPGGPTPMTVKIPEGQPFTLNGKIDEGSTLKAHDSQFDMDTVFFMKVAHLLIPLKTTQGTTAKSVPLSVRFQVCNDSLCLPPTTSLIIAQGP